MRFGKGGFPAARNADKSDDGDFRYLYSHRLNTPICVGAPYVLSASPILEN
jgi:hypothetical protein